MKKNSSKLSQTSNETPRMLNWSKYSSQSGVIDAESSKLTAGVKKIMHKSRSPPFRKAEKSVIKPKVSIYRSRSDKSRKQTFKIDSTNSQSFKLSPKNQTTKHSRMGSKKDYSSNSRTRVPKVSSKIGKKDYFGSKKNEVRYKKLKKRGFNNPLNIMNRAIINLNNSKTNSESSQERHSNSRERSNEPATQEAAADSSDSSNSGLTSQLQKKYEEIDKPSGVTTSQPFSMCGPNRKKTPIVKFNYFKP